MARGAATRGQMGALVAGAESVEFKATVPVKQIGAALRRLALKGRDAEERFIYFFDTPGLAMLEAGVIARARRIPGQRHDSTIKFRPVKAEEVPAKWRKRQGFKLEVDLSEKGAVQSASLTMEVEKGLIKKVGAGEEPVEKLFTATQEEFLAEMGRRRLDLGDVAVLGPIQAQRWEVEDPALPWKMIVELWIRDDGARMLEGSIKVPPVQVAAGRAGFLGYLAELGAERDKGQEAKTRWALEYYSAKLGGKKAARATA